MFLEGRDSLVDTAVCYGLDGLGIEYHWEVARFPATVKTGPEALAANYTIGTRKFLGIKRPRSGVNQPYHLAKKLKKGKSYISAPSLWFHGRLCSENYHFTFWVCGPGSSVGIANDYGLDGPGSNPGGDEIFRPVQTCPGAHPASCTMGTGSFPVVKCGQGVLLTTHSLLVSQSLKSTAIPLPNLSATPGL